MVPAGKGLCGEDSSTKKTPAHARLRIRPTVGLNLRATPSTVLSGTKGAGFFLQPLRLMIMHRTCISCDKQKPWREMVKWTTDPELEQKWSTALTANDCEKRNLEERVADLRRKNTIVYLCESHFDEKAAFTLTPSGFMLRPNAVPKNTRKKPLNDSSKKNSKQSNNKDLKTSSPTVTPNSKKEFPPAKRKQEESKKDEVPPKKKTPSSSPQLEMISPKVKTPPPSSTAAVNRGEENKGNEDLSVKKLDDARIQPTTTTSIFPPIRATEEKKEETTGITENGEATKRTADTIQPQPTDPVNIPTCVTPPSTIEKDVKNGEVAVDVTMNEDAGKVIEVQPVAGEEAVVKVEELDDVDNHPQDALASLEERIEAKLAEAEAEEAAAHLEEVLEDSNPSLDPVDDCIASVIRQATRPPSPPPMKLVKPNLSYEALCYEAFEYIEKNFQQSKLTMANICFYISNKYRLPCSQHSRVDEYRKIGRANEQRRGQFDGELRVKLVKKKVETVEQTDNLLNVIGSTPAVAHHCDCDKERRPIHWPETTRNDYLTTATTEMTTAF
ncbi:hypothetical protein PRIPAC_97100 [Pristionchus pacificus]|uniref:Uncharacterized protein n=1 Tax=Pristionchus pacificus TaxID=54126 RepID=A0A2A6BXQ4_PRIPA|nr:hypothetical protein PRIPAC_97100 [Pristionchus pacificus]|eukprot:PDM70659.1 hypothetical protein PRIPAC_43864 [Pristionchus pacificus]